MDVKVIFEWKRPENESTYCVIPFYKVKTNLKCQKADQWLPGHTGLGLRNGVEGKWGGITAEHFKQQNL